MTSEEGAKVGVFVCHCGVNISDVVDVPSVVEFAKTLPMVAEVQDNLFTCSAPGQAAIQEAIKEKGLNRVVVAACSPHMHEVTFQKAVEEAGMNKHQLEIANIREQVSWVHPKQPEKATQKAQRLTEMAVNKVIKSEPVEETFADVTKRVLVIGGGVTGLRAAIDIADQGYEVDLVERRPALGGHAARIGKLAHTTETGASVARQLIERAMQSDKITIYTNTEITEVNGSYGEYQVKTQETPRYIDKAITNPEKGVEVCPETTRNEYNYGLDERKAFYKPYEGVIPEQYVIDMDTCTLCDKCVEVCGSDVVNLELPPTEHEKSYGTIMLATGMEPYIPEPGEYGWGQSDKVVTLIQLERILSENHLREKYFNGSTKNVVFIGCVGSMEEPGLPGARTYCSRVCCSSSLKNMIEIKDQLPGSNVFFLYRDIRTYARKDEHLYEEASARNTIFLKYTPESKPRVEANGTLSVFVYDTMIQKEIEIDADLIVLANGITASSGIDKLQEILKLPCGEEGFIKEAHAKLRPVEVPAPGLYVAGTAAAPRDIIESVTSGSAAASKATIPLATGKVALHALQSRVNEEICGGCRICISVCPYSAIYRIEAADNTGREVAHVDPKLCQACGICTAACPSGAMQQYGFSDDQLFSMIRTIKVRK